MAENTFIALYDTTTWEEVKAAYDANQVIICKYVANSSHTYYAPLTHKSGTTFKFCITQYDVESNYSPCSMHTYTLSSTDKWTQTRDALQDKMQGGTNVTIDDKYDSISSNNKVIYVNDTSSEWSDTYNKWRDGYIVFHKYVVQHANGLPYTINMLLTGYDASQDTLIFSAGIQDSQNLDFWFAVRYWKQSSLSKTGTWGPLTYKSGSGGSGEPSQYLKDAVKSEDGNTLTITKKDGSQVIFTPQSGGGEPAQYIKDAAVASEKLTLTKKDGSTVELDISGKASVDALNAEKDARVQADETLAYSISTKLDKPNEPVAGKGLNIPYYFEVNYSSDKATVKDYTIDLLDKTKAPQQYSVDINSASSTSAGLMSSSDKIKLGNVETGLETEKNRATNAESAISARVGTIEYDYLKKADKDALHNEVLAEAAIRENADTVLNDRIDNLEARGRFLSVWDCTTGLPETEPIELPYTYKAGDYYIVGTVGEVNYRPNGSEYTGLASTIVQLGEVSVNDFYTYDGTNWILSYNTQKTITFSNITGNARDNTSLNTEFTTLETSIDNKADKTYVDTEVAKKLGVYEVTVNGAAGIYKGKAKVPVYFEIAANDDKVTVKSHSIDLDTNTKQTATVYSLDVEAATNTTAGLMKASDALAVRTNLPRDIAAKASQTDLTNEISNRTAADTTLQNNIDLKQDIITDLETIRSGAALGATAVQPAAISDMATKTWVGEQGFLTEHQSLAAYSTTEQMNAAIEEKRVNIFNFL